MTQAIDQLSREERRRLALRLRERRRESGGAAAAEEAIPRRGGAGPCPLSFAQQRLWFLDQLAPGLTAYNIGRALRLTGRLDPGALAASLAEIVRRHESLRTTFALVEGEPAQQIGRPGPVALPVVDLSRLPQAVREALALGLATGEVRRPFDLGRGPLLRTVLLRLAPGAWMALFTLHHIVADGWSLGLLVRELVELYSGFATGSPPSLPALPIQYGDFASWQRQWLTGRMLEEQLDYWRQRLGGTLPSLLLPTDHPYPAVRTFRGAHQGFAFPAALAERLRALGRSQGATLFMTLLAALASLLHRYTGEDDLLIGSPVSQRNRVETERLIGFFVNTVALRIDLAGDPSFLDLLERVRETALGAYMHQDLPFERLVEQVKPDRDLSRHPLFQVTLALENTPATTPLLLPGLAVAPVPAEIGSARIDLSLEFLDSAHGLGGVLEYSTELFEAPTVKRLSRHLGRLLQGAAEAPERRLSDLPLLPDDERFQLLAEWNDTGVAHASGICLHELIAAQARRTPGRVAVSGEGRELTYAELDGRANQLAHALEDLGVGPDVRVGVSMERSIELVVALLGVLKAGGAYVPIDPEYPAERVAWMLEDARAAVLLTREGSAPPPATGASVLALDPRLQVLAGRSTAPPAGGVLPDHLAYVLFTSGSTGRPKGAMIPHAAISHHMLWMQAAYPIGEADCVLQKTPVSFDASVWEFYAPLLVGGRLAVAPAGEHRDPGRLVARLAAEEVTVLQVVPTLLWLLLEEPGFRRCPHLRRVYCGGEALTAELAESFREALPGATLINVYGPTEATIHASSQAFSAGGEEPVSLGRPIHNAQIYVVDPAGGVAPLGIPGELLVGGAGLGRGYLERPELTAERFLPSPFAGEGGARLYRTGDLARFRASGTLEFLGRIDHQVKVRGFRIELGEIEAALREDPAVREAVVVARDDGEGSERLVAYLVAAEGATLEAGALRHPLHARLPGYMVPSAFVVLEALPLTPNGKVDRKALPAPPPARRDPGSAPAELRNPVEHVLAAIWEEVLRVERVGPRDDFFALGGHSLLAIRVLSRVRAALQVELPLRALFEEPTLAGLAARIEGLRQAGRRDPAPPLVPVPRDRDLPLSFAQERLWILHQLAPESPLYNMPLALRLGGPLDVPALARTVARIVERHETLRTTFSFRDGRPVQVIAPPAPLPLPVFDLAGLPEAAREAAARELVAGEAGRPFDLSRPPVVRPLLLRLGEGEHLFLVTLHHVSCDGWSMGVLAREVAALYEAFVDRREPALPALPVQYADFAVWQRQRLTGDFLATQLSYWRARLAGAPAALVLPVDRARPTVQTVRGGREARELPDDLVQPLYAFCRREGSTPFMLLLAAFEVLLHRASGQGSIVVGTPFANRERAEVEGLIGFFVNSLPLCTDLGDDPGFRQLLSRVRETALGAFTHHDLPFEKLLDELQIERDMSRAPIFQVFFVFESAPAQWLRLRHLELLPLGGGESEGAARFDLTLVCSEHRHGLSCHIDYDRNLFDPGTVAGLLRQLSSLLAGVAADPDTAVSDLPLLDAEERRQVVFAWNDTRREWAEGPGLYQLFARQAARAPESLAAISDQEWLTYGELDRLAGRLARRLRGLGVAAESRVAVCVERSPRTLVALLGILGAGGAYVPLDPESPLDRLAGILADAGAAVVVTQRHLAARLAGLPGRCLLVDGEDDANDADNEGNPGRAAPTVEPDNAAYVIYTSGSTGSPKGVVATHRGAVNFVHGIAGALALAPADRLLLFAPLSFDASVLQIFPTLASGAALVIHPEPRQLTARDIVDLCGRHGITVLDLPAALWRQWVEEVAAARLPLPASLRAFLTGGESVPAARLRTWAGLAGRPVSFLASYGPTEATVTTTVWQTTSGQAPTLAAAHVPIGRPLPNTRVYVLDRKLRPLPRGAAGELFLGGTGLARGYLGQPERTAEAFIPDPVSGEPGERLYRTGDLGRHRPDGDLQFLGRADHQVKVRGFRVEPGEIEAALARHAGVRQAVVALREDVPGDPRLVAYVVARESWEVTPAEMRAHLAELVPPYMVPSAILFLAELPVLPSGKLDRTALPAPGAERPELAAGFVAPRDPVEQVLAGIWAQVLRLERVGAADNFFELGGHSLTATQVIARIHEAFAIELPLRRIFESPTVAGLAAAMLEDPAMRERTEKVASVLIQLSGLSDEEVESLLAAQADS